ncbi:tyrosine-type recombinase/integrase [Chloroflexota bacterium]
MTNRQPIDGNHSLEPTVRALQQLSPQSQETAIALISQLAQREGVNMPLTSAPGLQSPAEGIPLWVAKLKAERYSTRTIHMYRYLAGRHLERDPEPTKLGVQQYLAKRLEEVSPALVSNERKALASLFRFLHGEGLWPTNPLNGVGHVRVRYREKLCPDIGDVLRVMGAGCARRRDTDKLRTLVLLLATTGLRATEAAGILKDNIDTEVLEMRVTGKGDRARVVPLLPQTAEALGSYMRRRRSSSPFLFPGNTRTGHMSIHNLEKTLRRMCLRLGVRPFTPHQLRHLYATTMLKGGAKLEVVSRILGHTGVGVTADIYRHVATEELHEEHIRFAPLNGPRALPEE